MENLKGLLGRGWRRFVVLFKSVIWFGIPAAAAMGDSGGSTDPDVSPEELFKLPIDPGPSSTEDPIAYYQRVLADRDRELEDAVRRRIRLAKTLRGTKAHVDNLVNSMDRILEGEEV